MKMLTVTEYSKEFKVSRPTVYKHIEDGKLKTKKVDGKKLIIVNDNVNEEELQQSESSISTAKEIQYLERIIEEKERTINKLEKTNERVIETLQSEIELLKQAFNEMRTLYTRLLNKEETKEVELKEERKEEEVEEEIIEHEPSWLDLKGFALKMKDEGLNLSAILIVIKKLLKDKDKRVVYQGENLMFEDVSYKDIL